MSNRREFLKRLAVLGATFTLPVPRLVAEDATSLKPVDEGLFAVRHKELRRPVGAPRTITIPDVGDYKVLKGDFHVHTLFSDGHVMPSDRVHEAIDNGLDVISLTEHIEHRPNIGGAKLRLVKNDDHNIAYRFAKPVAEEKDLILVPGTEITKPAWHFNALFTEDVNEIAEVADDWRQMLAVAAEQGAFVHWNHPSWVSKNETEGIKKGEPMRFFDEIEAVRRQGLVHGVEVFNGTSLYPVALDWCNERDLAPVVNSDVHQSEWNTYGYQNSSRPMTLVFAKERTCESVREAFFAKRTVGWAANMILGRNPWVERLFRACVGIEKAGNGLALRNRGDIPCLFDVSGKSLELPPQGSMELAGRKTLTVSNWFVGMNKPLEITLDS